MRKQHSIRKGVSSVARTSRPRPRFSLPELLEGRTLLSAYLVTNTADSGAGSLRAAIASVNADSTPDSISFAIGTGVQTISPATPLPALTNTVTIDGTAPSSMPGQQIVLSGLLAGAGANGLELDAAHSTINGLVINGFSGNGVYLPSGGADTISNDFIGTDSTGSSAVANGTGVFISSNGNTVSNDLISGNGLDGVYITGDGNTVQGSLIGTDSTGSLALPNGTASFEASGVRVVNASNTTIGGLTAALRNVISGNQDDAISFENDTLAGNVVEGNYIGLDVTGTTAVPNGGGGVDIGTANNLSSSLVTIGGLAAGAGNVISGNYGNGVYISSSSNNVVEGNFIGTTAAGVNTAFDQFGDPLQGNEGDGVRVLGQSGGNTIGGSSAAARNVISGNWGNGVYLGGSAAVANAVSGNTIGADATGAADGNLADGVTVVSGAATISGNVIAANQAEGVELAAGGAVVTSNFIGTNAAGAAGLGNLDRGILIYSNGNQIGAAGAGNTIADNGAAGIAVTMGVGNAIRANSIAGNGALGIDLGNNGTTNTTGVTPNDSAGHTGPNLFENFPVYTSANVSNLGTSLAGTLTASPSSSYVLDFFASASADATGYGQGQTYVGSATVTTDATGLASFNVKFPFVTSTQLIFSATATDASGNTSEFAMDVAATVTTVSPVVNTTTLLTSSADPSTFGQSVTFTATITANGTTPTGTVTFMDGSTVLAQNVPLNGNQASFTAVGLAVGGHNIVANYSGQSGAFNPSSASLTQNVNKAASSTTLSSNNNPSVFQSSVTFTATVTGIAGVTPTGTVSFFDGGASLGSANLVNGVAALSTSTLNVGNHTITALYNSDGNYGGSASNPITQTVTAPTNSISGKVFRDKTGDGLSSDDSVMSGVTIQLLQSQAGKWVVTQSVASDMNGAYVFTNLPSGTYEVQEVTPTGFVRTAPTTQAYYTNTLSGGGVVTADNFDNYMEGCCCDGSLSNVHYIIDGCRVVTNLRGQVHQGDTVQAVFTIGKGYIDTLSLVSYIAPGASFSAANASQQTIYQDATGTFGPGTYTLSVVVPKCYFQVDFVCGYAIDKFGPAGSNIFYSAQDRLISADNGGTNAAPTH